ncbi:MAG TPA: VTT domain-containing protein [Rhodanobacteraceae bacterium]|jgi:membrane protein YqaA with SNARE-associated domain|nr:VTT domain-containing protein [Rhodanobacteraceae bacterium]
MKLFKPFYEWALVWSAKPRADVALAGLSFVEAFIFPVMPEIMLAPMTLARPRKWWQLASLSLGFSLLGSLVGYALGHYAFEALKPLLDTLHLLAPIESGVARLTLQMHSHEWGLFGVLVLAALIPVVPMKFVTWACGIIGVPILPFLGCIALGRGKRVFLLAGAIRLGGERAERLLHKYIEIVGWVSIAILAVLALYFWLR